MSAGSGPSRARAAIATVVVVALLALGPRASFRTPDPEPVAHRANHIASNGWTFSYWRSATDGLIVTSGRLNGIPIFERISIPQCRVGYFGGSATMNDNLGRDGNIHYVAGSTRLRVTKHRTTLRALFQCCGWPRAASYRYGVRYTFWDDGRMRPSVAVYGPGLEPRARYECTFRIDLDVDGPDDDGFLRYHGGLWSAPRREGGFPSEHDSFTGASWQLFDGPTFLRLEPGDADQDPRLWAIRAHAGQGARDLGWTIARPAAFDTDEPIQGHDLVVWYVPSVLYHRPKGCVRRASRCTPVLTGLHLDRRFVRAGPPSRPAP